MNTATTLIDKALTVKAVVYIETWITTGEYKSVSHSCGHSVSGKAELVEEAHRQHLLHCSGEWRR